MFKRRRNKKTDYKKRLALLKSEKVRVVVKRSLNYIHIQFIKYEKQGDKIILEETSKNLKKYGWQGHKANLPSAYLTGLMAGFAALKKGVSEAVLDLGLNTSIKGNAIYAAVIGIKDSGVKIPMNKEVPRERIEGKHISEYAKKMKQNDQEKFNKQFSDYIKAGFEPEKLNEHFVQIKNKILEETKG